MVYLTDTRHVLLTSLMAWLRIIIVTTLELNISETRPDSFNVQPIGTCLWAINCACSRWGHVTGWRHNNDFTLFSLKCFFSDNSCQNWTIPEYNVPLYGVSIWSSRIVDLGLMTSLMTSSRIIVIDTKRATSQTSLPVSFTEVLVSFKRCALLRYLPRLILASEPCRLQACTFSSQQQAVR